MSEVQGNLSVIIKECPVCGKKFTVLWPQLWTFKRGPGKGKYKYICSYGCARKFDKGVKQKMPGGHRVLTDEMKKEAIRIAQEGGNPLPYLGKCGSKNPSAAWSSIRTALKETDPEEYAKLPKMIRTGEHSAKAKKAEKGGAWAETVDAFYSHKKPEPSLADAREGMQEATDKFFDSCRDMGILKAETQEQPKITKPLNYDGFEVQKIKGKYASYDLAIKCSDGSQILTVDTGLEELSFDVKDWPLFLAEFINARQILGVEV